MNIWAVLALLWVEVTWVVLGRVYGLDLLTITFGCCGLVCIALSLWVARREHLNERRDQWGR